MSIKNRLIDIFKKNNKFTLKEAYEMIDDVKPHSIRARIYENLDTCFEKISKGVYKIADAILIQGDGRDLSFLEDNSIDLLLADHEWLDDKSNKGGNRNFSNGNGFKYELRDFEEKFRVLKDGCFLAEIIPSENENNFDYLYEIKKMAQQAGFKYYSKVQYKKGAFISNTGRNSKNSEDVMIFTKGKARALRIDAKKTKQMNDGLTYRMSGANKMLPTCFDHQPTPKKEQYQKSEKPINLYREIIQYLSLENEIVVDQFAGSGNSGIASRLEKRKCILIEILKNHVENIKNNFMKHNLELSILG